LNAIDNLLGQQDYDYFGIFYSGHGRTDTGDWVFSSTYVSFEEVEALFVRHRDNLLALNSRGQRKSVYIQSDACYSGAWVVKIYESAVLSGPLKNLIVIQGVCSENQVAYDTTFNKETHTTF
jgi:hypothetical protein